MSEEVLLKVKNRYIPIPENYKPDIIVEKDGKIIIVEIKPYNNYQDLKPKVVADAINDSITSLHKITGHQVLTIIKEKMPTKDDVKNFILSQEGFKHNVYQLSEHFFGIRIPYIKDDKESKNLYDAFWKKIARARNEIATKSHGKWETKYIGFGIPKIYSFVKI